MHSLNRTPLARREALRVLAIAPVGLTPRMTDPTPLTPFEYGALGDGSGSPVAEWLAGGKYDRGYADINAIRVDYEHVSSLQDSIDWAALQKALSNGPRFGVTVSFVSSAAVFVCNRTICPRGQVTLDAAGATIRFVSGDLYERISAADGKLTRLKLAWDTIDGSGSTIRGGLNLQGITSTNRMDLATQNQVDQNLVCISSSGTGRLGAGSNTIWERLDIVGFGYGLFTIDNKAGSDPVQPFTRCVFNLLEIRFCKYPIWFGRGRNSFDDSVVITYRQARCFGPAVIHSTEFTAVSAFVHAGKDVDAEPQLVDGLRGSAHVNVAGGVPKQWKRGMSIVIEDGRQETSRSDDLVSVIVAVTPDTIELADPLPQDVAGGRVWLRLSAAFTLERATLNVQRLYLEGRMHAGIIAYDDTVIAINVLKISDGRFATRSNFPIWLVGLHVTCIIQALHEKVLNNQFIRGLVAAPMLRRGDVTSARSIELNINGLDLGIEPVAHNPIPRDLLPADMATSTTTRDQVRLIGTQDN